MFVSVGQDDLAVPLRGAPIKLFSAWVFLVLRVLLSTTMPSLTSHEVAPSQG